MSTIEERVAALESALASMTAAEKRIVELPAASSVANDDFVALDGVANGSRRFAASNLGGKAEVMTEAEWDDLPDSKLTDGKVYALSGVSPSTQDNPLWQKLGFAALDTTADDCSDAINELNTGLTTLNSNFVGKGTHTINVFGCYGFVSGGAKAIYLFIPVNIAGDVTSISSITALKIGLRTSGSGGYAGGADNLDVLSNVVQKEVQKLHGYIMVRLDSTNAWANCVNNSVVCGTANITFTLA